MSKADSKEKGKAFISTILSATAASRPIQGQRTANYKEFDAVVSVDDGLTGKASGGALLASVAKIWAAC